MDLFVEELKVMSLAFKSFHKMVVTQFDAKFRSFHSDNGGEYIFDILSSYFDESSIVHQTSYPSIPEQNGVAAIFLRLVMFS